MFGDGGSTRYIAVIPLIYLSSNIAAGLTLLPPLKKLKHDNLKNTI